MTSGTYWQASPTLASPAEWTYDAGSPQTPDGATVASWGRRALARVIDGFLAMAVLAVAWIVAVSVEMADTELGERAGATSSADTAIAVVNAVLLVVGVFGPSILFEIWCIKKWGASPGKRLMGLRVRRFRSEEPLSWGIVLGRWAVWAGLWVVPFGRVLDYLWPLWDHRRQALHDKVGTVVVSTR